MPSVSNVMVDLAKVFDSAIAVPLLKSVGNSVFTVKVLGSAPSVVIPPMLVSLNSVPE